MGLPEASSPCGQRSLRFNPRGMLVPCVYWPIEEDHLPRIADLAGLGESALRTPPFQAARRTGRCRELSLPGWLCQQAGARRAPGRARRLLPLGARGRRGDVLAPCAGQTAGAQQQRLHDRRHMSRLSHPGALIVVAKRPVPGQTKTRLAPPLTAEQAAGLYGCLLADTLDLVRSVPQVQRVIAYLPAQAEAYFAVSGARFRKGAAEGTRPRRQAG